MTLLFSVHRYEQAIEAYLRGLERRVAEGRPIASRRLVASFFVSPVDAKATCHFGRIHRCAAASPLAYSRYRQRFAGQRWEKLREHGATAQRPLWASTGTKDPAYSDVLYVEHLVAPDVINTMPEAALLASDDHGEIAAFDPDPARPRQTLAAAAQPASIWTRSLRSSSAKAWTASAPLPPAPALHRSQGRAIRHSGDVRPAARDAKHPMDKQPTTR